MRGFLVMGPLGGEDEPLPERFWRSATRLRSRKSTGTSKLRAVISTACLALKTGSSSGAVVAKDKAKANVGFGGGFGFEGVVDDARVCRTRMSKALMAISVRRLPEASRSLMFSQGPGHQRKRNVVRQLVHHDFGVGQRKRGGLPCRRGRRSQCTLVLDGVVVALTGVAAGQWGNGAGFLVRLAVQRRDGVQLADGLGPFVHKARKIAVDVNGARLEHVRVGRVFEPLPLRAVLVGQVLAHGGEHGRLAVGTVALRPVLLQLNQPACAGSARTQCSCVGKLGLRWGGSRRCGAAATQR